jgi:hypothetical protein
MPSLFHKRRGSDIPTELSAEVSPSNANRSKQAHPPVDTSFANVNAPGSPPSNGGGKLRSLFRGSMSEEKKDNMRRRLSSPSELFKPRGSEAPRSDIAAGWEEVNRSPGGPGGSGGSVDPIPRSPTGRNGAFAPSIFPENFSLSQSASPEGSARGARDRGSKQWTPSYPLVLPEGEDQYADLAPDGQTNGGQTMPVSVGGSENDKRRSMDLRNNDIPRTLAAWEPLKPDAPKKIESVPQSTTPEIAKPAMNAAQKPTLQLQTGGFVTATRNDTQPLLSSEASSRRESEEPLVDTPLATSRPASPPISTPITALASGPTSPTTNMAPIPGMIVGPNGKMRPAMPSRRTTLIQSPPMPQPIKNLPTMQGWPGFNQMQSGAITPAWGKDAPKTPGMPRTPGWSAYGASGPSTPRTPGGGGFPFGMGMGSATKEKGKTASSEEELRKMRRAMVSFALRQRSDTD